jgi:hypothetical protein
MTTLTNMPEKLSNKHSRKVAHHDIDTTKLLPNHITALVVHLNENIKCIRLAMEKGLLKGWYNYMRVKVKRGVNV